MTWPRVILFAIITAVYTALINQVPFLYDTSFQDISINLECWILFAMLIITNCNKWWEASLKCFAFFLISQPLIYLIEVPFASMGWQLFQYYGHWARITLLTLPGAAIAFQVKKKSWLSVAVLAVATGFLSFSFVTYLRNTSTNFPHHLLSALFCVALALLLIFALFDKKQHLIASLLVVAVIIIVSVFITGRARSTDIPLGEGEWSYTTTDDTIAKVEIQDGKAKITAKKNGDAILTFESRDGTSREVEVTVSGGSVWLTFLDEE